MDNSDPNNPNQNSTEGTFPTAPTQPPTNAWDPPINPSLDPMSVSSPQPQTPAANTPLPTTDSNPYLQQPQTPLPTNPAIFSGSQEATGPQNPAPLTQNPLQPNPLQSVQLDPLNTAFTPTSDPNAQNPFNTTGSPAPAPELPKQPDLPKPEFPTPPVADSSLGASVNQPIPPSSPQGTIDLSQLQNSSNPSPEGTPTQPGDPLPEMGPVENAPTDLSHLIAGDEQHQQPADIYNPSVASDQNPTINPTQPLSVSEDGTAPPDKHLNLTKVLLVAGIPIILIVAALSAYMFLGIGKSSPQSDKQQTSLPIEKSNQAPLTNPPSQIVAPSPTEIPEPQASNSALEPLESTTSGSSLPISSSSSKSAIEQLKARQSASPKASTSTSLP